MRTRRFAAAALLASFTIGQAAADYNPAFCDAVAGTMNLHWELIAGGAECTGIEFTNGTLADAADGNINMAGTSVSNAACIGTDVYTFTMTHDGFALDGFATGSGVHMTMTRTPDQQCFVGNWVSGGFVYQAYLFAGGFAAPVTVPATDNFTLALLAAILAMSGAWFVRRKQAPGTRG